MALFKAARAVLLALTAVVLLAAAPAAAGAEFPQVRLTHFGPDGDLTQQAGFPAVAFNSQANQYLLVYQAGPTGDTNHWPIYGQLIDAAGNPVGGQITVSLPTANRICNYEPPNVAYSERLNEFLVTWNEGTAATCDDSIYAQRIGADGSLLAVPSQQISGAGFTDTETTDVVYNPAANEWLVAWKSRQPGVSANQELFGQRLGADGTQVGTNDQKLTDFRGAGGNANDAMAVAVDPRDSRYLLVVRAIDPTKSNRLETYGHLMAADGSVVGPDHFRISHVSATNPTGASTPPMVAYDPNANDFLVAWAGNPMIGAMAAGEQDIFGRLVSPDGSVVGSSDARYSDVGPDGSNLYQALRPDIGFNPNANEYFLGWSGDDNVSSADDESEVFGQRMASNGSELGDNDFRISHDGPDGNINAAANRPSLGYNSSICQYLVVWQSGNVGNFGNGNEEWDIYGNLVDTPCPPVNLAPPQISGTAQAGQTLSCSIGSWSGRGLAFSYQWLSDGNPIGGATSATYVPTALDVGHQIACQVTASDPDGTASATSAAVTPVAAPAVSRVVVAPPDKTPPICRASVPRQKSKKVRTRGLTVKVSCNEAAKVRAVLILPAKLVKRLRAARALTAGKATKSSTKAGKFSLVIKLNKKAKALLKKAKTSVKVTLQTRATDKAGNVAKKRTKTVKLKR